MAPSEPCWSVFPEAAFVDLGVVCLDLSRKHQRENRKTHDEADKWAATIGQYQASGKWVRAMKTYVVLAVKWLRFVNGSHSRAGPRLVRVGDTGLRSQRAGPRKRLAFDRRPVPEREKAERLLVGRGQCCATTSRLVLDLGAGGAA